MNPMATLRELLSAQRLIVAPGAYDCIGARQIEQAGYPAVYMTGAGTSAARGYPDFGLLTMTEMVDNATSMQRAIRLPLIADADTSYGNELNVTRTVRDFEAAGVAAIHIEDQVSPKRCGHLDGKQVISRDDFVSKIRAAVEARRDPAFVIIARTDAGAVIDLDEAIARAKAALDAGADIAFVEATQSVDEMAAVPRRVGGPCLPNIVPGGRTPNLSLSEIEAMGYRLAIFPGLLLQAAVVAGDAALAALKATQRPPEVTQSVAQAFRRFGADEWDALRSRFNAGATIGE